jgi:hypothetical protein
MTDLCEAIGSIKGESASARHLCIDGMILSYDPVRFKTEPVNYVKEQLLYHRKHRIDLRQELQKEFNLHNELLNEESAIKGQLAFVPDFLQYVAALGLRLNLSGFDKTYLVKGPKVHYSEIQSEILRKKYKYGQRRSTIVDGLEFLEGCDRTGLPIGRELDAWSEECSQISRIYDRILLTFGRQQETCGNIFSLLRFK